LRQEALERLGWRLTLWSTDWFLDPLGQTERLSREINAVLHAIGQSDAERGRLIEIHSGLSKSPENAMSRSEVTIPPIQHQLPLQSSQSKIQACGRPSEISASE
jgi:hypothetical protein